MLLNEGMLTRLHRHVQVTRKLGGVLPKLAQNGAQYKVNLQVYILIIEIVFEWHVKLMV